MALLAVLGTVAPIALWAGAGWMADRELTLEPVEEAE